MTRPTPRPLRVVVATNGLAITGGVERCVVEDVGELVAAGHDVEVWHRAGPDGDPDEGRAVFDRLGVRLRHARDYRFGIRTAPTDVFRFVREGLRLRRSRPDVLWLNRPEFLPWGRVVSFVSGVPLAVHLHHAPNYRRLGPFAGGRTRYLAVSAAMARAWTAVGAPPDRVDVVPNGVDTAAFPAATPASTRRARAALGLDQDRPVVLYYGRLTRSKGVLALLEAWGRVHASARVLVGPGTPPAPAPVLVLAGALYPQDAPAVHRAIAALPEGSVVVVPERDDVVPLLHAADVVVAPSIEPEGFGRVVVEAMSTGRPVVAAASGGTAEILSGEWTRFTVDPTETAALADKVLEALHAAETEPGLADRCRAWVRDRYGRERHVAALLRALEAHAKR
ncbi:glycosyltransferase family 4 protein [Curtobacterium sp. VKM Ac-2861]|uniref:glycosyltransferase family 4 protein n=1 Tax=unclassified Curtobacterium TaxID=257496 RepID=UPI001063E4D1|nr:MULTISPECIES: glycosyltransferase family 4 protein [unclassified Curtobacterium]NQW89601.1 glycosyltransferase family 4 protein [Curtobacterium sp. VKM Ac-2861]TDW50734.1 glycosyltransferase involved in cell wall biosynthesis [Curtobacterium sp. PhB42]TDW54963.1 glycosyltransferase involved in cell wall biosynthesis [Curtobacterium sp. PhB190]